MFPSPEREQKCLMCSVAGIFLGVKFFEVFMVKQKTTEYLSTTD